MLTDRKALLEHELIKLKTQAANMYLGMVISENSVSHDYDMLRRQIMDMEFDLSAVNSLLKTGHQ